jgi:enediyne biosynthesis protein E3
MLEQDRSPERIRTPAYTGSPQPKSGRSNSPFVWLRHRILGISPEEASFDRRQFKVDNVAARQRLEKSGRKFLEGYQAVLDDDRIEPLVSRLNTIENEYRGFAFEGAAMGLAILGFLTPWKNNRLHAFIQGPGDAHAYMVHVGVGWALARFPWQMKRTLAKMDPLLRWLAIDGYGFHEGYFHWRRYLKSVTLPSRFSGHGGRVFDQGLGRSLWFVEGGDITRIPLTIAGFPLWRRGDLWSGIGLACAYAGAPDHQMLKGLRAAAGPYIPNLAQGVAFAAKTRKRAGNPASHTELACEILCEMSSDKAAEVTDAALVGLTANGAEPEYAVWRRRIQTQFLGLAR